MIVQPDFLEHWKTRQLIELTGDESAPLAVIRLWGYCQTSRCSYWPDMTPAQLASICRWNNRKPACHIALVKSGFVEKLTPKGFTAHGWNECNAKLLANWENGKLGGRPKKEETANESVENKKPVGSGGLTQPKPIDQIDQTRSEKIEKTSPDQNDQTPAIASLAPKSDSPPTVWPDGIAFNEIGMDGIGRIAHDIAASKSAPPFSEPSLQDIKNYLKCSFNGAEKYAAPFLKAMTKSHWRDKQGALVQDWQAMAKEYASAAARNQISRT